MKALLVLLESLRLDCFLKDLYYSSRKFACNIQVGYPLQSNPYAPSRLVEEGNFRLMMYDIQPKISNQPNCPNKQGQILKIYYVQGPKHVDKRENIIVPKWVLRACFLVGAILILKVAFYIHFGKVLENLLPLTSSVYKLEQFCKVEKRSPEKLLQLSFSQLRVGSERNEVGMLPNRLFCDRSMASKFCILIQCLGMFPDKRLFDKSTNHKPIGPMVNEGILLR